MNEHQYLDIVGNPTFDEREVKKERERMGIKEGMEERERGRGGKKSTFL